MKKLFYGLMMVMFAAMNFAAKSVSAQDLKIGVIDILQINKDAKVMKSLNSQKEKMIKDIQASVISKRKELEKREQDLKVKQPVMNEKAFAKEVQTFQMDMLNFDKQTQKKLASVEEGYVSALQKIQKDYLDRILNKLGKEKSFSLILSAQNAVVLDKTLDVTKDAISLLDNEITELKLEVK